jgi:hypothetical protein
MKLYIVEDNPQSLSFLALAKDKKNRAKMNKIILKLEKYLIKKQSIIDIYSKQGIYQINENHTHKLYVKSEKPHENIILKNGDDKNITLVIDDSIIEKELVNQIPYEHVTIPLIIHKYSLNKKNSLGPFLVIEFFTNNKEEQMRPINYYFEYGNNDNNIPIEDINVFLSLLN